MGRREVPQTRPVAFGDPWTSLSPIATMIPLSRSSILRPVLIRTRLSSLARACLSSIPLIVRLDDGDGSRSLADPYRTRWVPRRPPECSTVAASKSPKKEPCRSHVAQHRGRDRSSTQYPALGSPVCLPPGDRTGKGSLTMSRMFCTLQEAARTLHASEDQINALVEHGILQEFREGPHRLLRESDIDVLDGLRPKMEDAGGPSRGNFALGNPEQRTEDREQKVEDSALLCPASSALGILSSRMPTASPRRAGKQKARRRREAQVFFRCDGGRAIRPRPREEESKAPIGERPDE